MKVKRRLTSSEEFELMKLVMDKFLWLGTALMGFGLYVAIAQNITNGLYYILAGAIVMVLFAVIVVREFERIR